MIRNYIKAQRRKYRKKQSQFIAEHEFKRANELHFTREELRDMLEQNTIIYMEFSGKKQFPTFQFNSDGQVYPVLQEHLPRLLNSDWNSWEICFWLYDEHSIVLKALRANAGLLKKVTTIDEVLKIAEKAKELTETCIAKPIDLATAGNSEAFTAFVENWLAPDHRVIPEPELPENFWESFFDEQNC